MQATAPGQLFIGTPLQGRVSKRWAVPVAARFSQPSHGVSIILIGIETELFDRAFHDIRSDRDPIISLVRRDGVLLARSATHPLELGVSVAQSPVFTQGLKVSPQGVLPSSSVATDHIPRLLAYGAMNNYPLVIVAGEPVEAIEAPTWQKIRIVASLLLLIMLVTLFRSWRSLKLLAALRASQEELARLAGIDELTGLKTVGSFSTFVPRKLSGPGVIHSRWRFLKLISTFSSASTMPMVTRRATPCCRRLPGLASNVCAMWILLAVWAARSLACCCPIRMPREPCVWPNALWQRQRLARC